jgi:ketosteroid isomerase-like protein
MPTLQLSALLLAAVLLAAPAEAQVRDTAATKASVLAADRNLAQAVARSGAEAFIRALEPGAAVLIPGQPVLKGPAGSRSAFLARYGSPSSYSWAPTHAVASRDGRLACTFGYSSFTNSRDTVRAVRRGTYLTCWRRYAGGEWRVAGTQRADSPPAAPAFADSSWLPGGPHSATVSKGVRPLAESIEADSLFAMMGAELAGPGPAFAKYAAEDALLVGGEEFPRGPEGMAAAFATYSPDRVITWRPMRGFGAGSGGLAFTVGHSVSGPRPGKTGPSIPQKYFSVWRQEPDGRWLYIFDLGSSRPPE